MGLLDWVADKIQESTGEKERRSLVQKIKSEYDILRSRVIKKLESINKVIDSINNTIRALNLFRKEKVESTIISLGLFLGKFGKVKAIGDYAPERECPPVELPAREFDQIESYIQDVDWSKEDVFSNTLFFTPIGMTITTKKQNVRLQEGLSTLRLEANEILRELEIRQTMCEQEQRVATIYKGCVEYIISTIEIRILPELRLVEAFFDAMEIKDCVIANKLPTQLTTRIDVSLLKNTKYHKHYVFIKNTFMFYIIACRIYNTPILTRLLQGRLLGVDEEDLQEQQCALFSQGLQVSDSLMIQGK